MASCATGCVVTPDTAAEEIERLALASERVQAYLKGRAPRRVVQIPGKPGEHRHACGVAGSHHLDVKPDGKRADKRRVARLRLLLPGPGVECPGAGPRTGPSTRLASRDGRRPVSSVTRRDRLAVGLVVAGLLCLGGSRAWLLVGAVASRARHR